MPHGFHQYVSHQSLVNSLSTAHFVFHLKLHYLVSQPLDGCVDLIILGSDLAYCFKKRVLVISGHGAQGWAPRAVWRHLGYVSETLVTHKQFRVDQPRVTEAQRVGIEGKPGM